MTAFLKVQTGRVFCMIGLVCGLNCATAFSGDTEWNQFRGPRADGTSLAKNLPLTFSEGSSEIKWKTPIRGRGWSSPVVAKNRIWLTTGPEIQNLKEGEKLEKPLELAALCVDFETGKILFDQVLFKVETPQFTHVTNSYASPTPYIDGDFVYIHFGAYGTACLELLTGKKVWERTDLPCDHFRGPGSSPVIYGDLLYLTFDGADFQYLAALDKRTGKTVWKRDRDIDYGTTDGDYKKAYSTPLLIEVDGRKLLVSPFAMATIAYDPLSGEPVWTVRHGGMNAAGRPLFGNGLVYISAADGPNALVAVKPTGTGDISKQIVWKMGKGVVPKRPSQILVGDRMFMMNDGGVATCVNALTSESVWTKRYGGDYWASPILANGLIYCFSQGGAIPVFKASGEFEAVAENKLDDGFNASPAVVGDTFILRSKTNLYRIEK